MESGVIIVFVTREAWSFCILEYVSGRYRHTLGRLVHGTCCNHFQAIYQDKLRLGFMTTEYCLSLLSYPPPPLRKKGGSDRQTVFVPIFTFTSVW